MSTNETPTAGTDRAFPNIHVRPLRQNRIGVTISGTEYSLTPLDAYRLQTAIEWALKQESPT